MFSHLEKDSINKIIDKNADELQAQLAERNIRLQLTPAARKQLAEKGYDPAMGARPMARIFQSSIKDLLTEHILSQEITTNQKITIDFNGAKFSVLSFTKDRNKDPLRTNRKKTTKKKKA